MTYISQGERIMPRGLGSKKSISHHGACACASCVTGTEQNLGEIAFSRSACHAAQSGNMARYTINIPGAMHVCSTVPYVQELLVSADYPQFCTNGPRRSTKMEQVPETLSMLPFGSFLPTFTNAIRMHVLRRWQ